MRVSGDMQAYEKVKLAFAFMGTEINKTTRIPADALSDEAKAAGPNDLILMIESDDEAAAKIALAEFEKKITDTGRQAQSGAEIDKQPATLDEGFIAAPDSNIAIISVPGQYAAAQAMRALQLGLNVHLFSDNVSLNDEIGLKKFAAQNREAGKRDSHQNARYFHTSFYCLL
jgi:FdrA protein